MSKTLATEITPQHNHAQRRIVRTNEPEPTSRLGEPQRLTPNHRYDNTSMYMHLWVDNVLTQTHCKNTVAAWYMYYHNWFTGNIVGWARADAPMSPYSFSSHVFWVGIMSSPDRTLCAPRVNVHTLPKDGCDA